MKNLFTTLSKMLNESRVVIDRPKGSQHPRYPDQYTYPLDYGYIDGTKSQDGDGIDVWLGSGDQKLVSGILVVADPVKKDSEIKVLVGCSEDEMRLAYDYNNRGEQAALLVKNEVKL